MRDRVWYRNIDFPLVLLWLALVGVGLVAIYSTTHGPASEFLLESVKQNFQRQLMWMGICTVGIVVALLLPVRFYRVGAIPIYVGTLLLLVAALLFGREVNGAKSWLELGPLRLQVSELAKVGTLLAVAHLLASKRPGTAHMRYALGIVALILLPAVLIILQNDMGTALVFLGLIPVMLFWSGIPLEYVLLVVSPAIAGYLGIWFGWWAMAFAIVFTVGMYLLTRDGALTAVSGVFTGGTVAAFLLLLPLVLKPYQVQRILSFTNPEAEEYRMGVGFHLVQSKAAIGSGGLTGKGFMEGTQTQGAYVPEQSTDFVFSVIGEEFGFLGTITILVLFAAFLTRLIYLGMQVKHPFGTLVAAGAAGIFLLHIFINVGMVTGLLPVIGIPLPFISYGGSALLANTAMLAIVLSLYMRRDDFSIYGY